MAHAEKEAVVRQVADIFKKAKSVFVTDFTGLNVEQTMALRMKFRESKVGYVVVKNTLARIAAEQAGCSDLGKYLKGPSAIAYSFDDPSSPARIIKDFTKTLDKPKIKVSLLEGEFYGPEQTDAIASMPSKKELLARVVGGFNSPIQAFAGCLHGLLAKTVRTLDAVRLQKENA